MDSCSQQHICWCEKPLQRALSAALDKYDQYECWRAKVQNPFPNRRGVAIYISLTLVPAIANESTKLYLQSKDTSPKEG